ncbi:fungal-specific transcription factor domain-containing protein [Aspergillus pseudoustus]|uniref:Fungal-specific transcription factor domain-containing protein n=1 Tax=Aspergillus pseudoustus TaxID=1810923 RepID=A0ABR4IXY8_9EURO
MSHSSHRSRVPTQPLACLNCRRSKVKCRGKDITGCKRCIDGDMSCVMPTQDERKRPSSKHHIRRLEDRIQQLEGELRTQKEQSSGTRTASTDTINTPSSELFCTPETPAAGAFISELCSRRHRVIHDGNGGRCYYGPTAGLNLGIASSMTPLPATQAPKVMQVRSELQSEVYKQLLTSFWRDHNTVMPIVHQDAFLFGMIKGIGLYYSSALHYAMCACAALMTGSHAQPQIVRTELFQIASKCLQEESSYPQITTVQTLHILAVCEFMQGNMARGWLLSGNACRLLYALGLHRDMPETLPDLGFHAHQQVRQTVCWGSFILDRFWAMYLGRPPCMNIADIQVPRPGGPSEEMKVFSALIEIVELTEAVQRTLNTGESSQDAVRTMGIRLSRWHSSLPGALHYHGDVQPGLAMLHLHYNCAIILLHRAFAALGQPLDNSQPGSLAQALECRSKCVHAATMIARILENSAQTSNESQAVPISVFYIIMLAALILMADLSDQREANICDAQLQQGEVWSFRRCMGAMALLENHLQPARTAITHIRHIVHVCQLENMLLPANGSMHVGSKDEVKVAYSETGLGAARQTPQCSPDRTYSSYDLLHDAFYNMLTGSAPVPDDGANGYPLARLLLFFLLLSTPQLPFYVFYVSFGFFGAALILSWFVPTFDRDKQDLVAGEVQRETEEVPDDPKV